MISRLGHPLLHGNRLNMGPEAKDQDLIQCPHSSVRKEVNTPQHVQTGGMPSDSDGEVPNRKKSNHPDLMSGGHR